MLVAWAASASAEEAKHGKEKGGVRTGRCSESLVSGSCVSRLGRVKLWRGPGVDCCFAQLLIFGRERPKLDK